MNNIANMGLIDALCTVSCRVEGRPHHSKGDCGNYTLHPAGFPVVQGLFPLRQRQRGIERFGFYSALVQEGGDVLALSVSQGISHTLTSAVYRQYTRPETHGIATRCRALMVSASGTKPRMKDARSSATWLNLLLPPWYRIGVSITRASAAHLIKQVFPVEWLDPLSEALLLCFGHIQNRKQVLADIAGCRGRESLRSARATTSIPTVIGTVGYRSRNSPRRR